MSDERESVTLDDVLTNWNERTKEHMEEVRIMCVPPPTMEALLACAEALVVTRGQWIHSVNAQQCLAAIEKLESL